jgi:tRNA threonylcarbamoyladenosine biosynthesis protein TsaB
MLILSLDSAGSSCSACLWQDGMILGEAEEKMERGQDQRLMPLILNIMKQGHITFKMLDRVAVTRGPGSFTGLRIGLACARGIGLSADKPVIGIDRFPIYYHGLKVKNKDVLVIIGSKRKELFCKFYPINQPANDPCLMTFTDIEAFIKDKPDVLITGDADISTINNFYHVSQKEVITCAVLASKVDINDPAFHPHPLYLRMADVTVKKA